MEGLHHDTVLDVPRSITKQEDPMPSSEKKDEADQQKQEVSTDDKSLGNDAPKASEASPEEGCSGNTISNEDTEPIPKKTDDDDERQVENEVKGERKGRKGCVGEAKASAKAKASPKVKARTMPIEPARPPALWLP